MKYNTDHNFLLVGLVFPSTTLPVTKFPFLSSEGFT